MTEGDMMIENAGRLVAVTSLALFAVMCAPARGTAGLVKKIRLGPMNIQYAGLDLNGDDYDDAVLVNIVSGEKSLMLGRKKGGYRKTSLQSLSAEEKDFLPDMFTEVDLDGDHVNDLVVVNRGRLARTADDRSFLRVLEWSVFFGEDGANFRSVRLSTFSEEQREALLRNARPLLMPPEESAPEEGRGQSALFK
jgi:hypothetical protein